MARYIFEQTPAPREHRERLYCEHHLPLDLYPKDILLPALKQIPGFRLKQADDLDETWNHTVLFLAWVGIEEEVLTQRLIDTFHGVALVELDRKQRQRELEKSLARFRDIARRARYGGGNARQRRQRLRELLMAEGMSPKAMNPRRARR